MDYCTYGYMIDNIVLIVTGTLHERNVQARTLRKTQETLARLHLGKQISWRFGSDKSSQAIQKGGLKMVNMIRANRFHRF